MPLFDQYTPPSVIVRETVASTGTNVFGSQRVTVFIGEGQETRSYTGVAMHRGSSSQADEQVVQDSLSDQAVNSNRTFQLQYWPLVKGDGKGTITNDPKYLKVYVNGSPVLVSTLDGANGVFKTQSLVPAGSEVTVSYYFKRTDTLVTKEDLSYQVPSFAGLTATFTSGSLHIAPSLPGALGNNVAVAFTKSSAGVADALAVTGIGSDAISVELTKADASTRTVQEVADLLNAGIYTLSGGTLSAAVISGAATAASALASASLSGGNGPNSNTTFIVKNVPIVDGTNGGVVTNSPSAVTVLVNGASVKVANVDGDSGQITLASAVPYGAVVTVTYYTNTFQNTFDVIPGINVASLDSVGYGAGRTDFINGTDYVLETTATGSRIQWGASTSTQAASTSAGYTALDGTSITTTLKDERVSLRPVSGVVDGKNLKFTLEDVPVDGSGRSVPTHNPSDIRVYVGATPALALAAGPVRVVSLNGYTGAFSLYNPPSSPSLVFASYNRSVLADHQYTIQVVNPGVTGQGTFKILNENGVVAPKASVSATSKVAANGAFAQTGIVWPYSFSDLRGQVGASPDETITLTFQDDSLSYVSTPSVQATNLTAQTGLRFRATTPGVAPNGVTAVVLSNAGGPTQDSSAVTVAGEVVTIQIVNGSSATRTLQDVINLFTATTYSTPLAGRILVEAVDNSVVLTNSVSAHASTTFSGGAAAVTSPYANRFKVTSNRTSADTLVDGLGITGGVSGSIGYLGQTYIDKNTGVQFTVVDPQQALSYGYTTLPSPSYRFAPGDTLVFTISSSSARATSAVPTIDILGIHLIVKSTYGTKAGDTAIINTYNKSGNEPSVGSFYYVDFTSKKADKDYDLKIYSNLSDVVAEYGQPSPTNKLSLAAKLFLQNGGQVFGCLQVPKQTGLEVAGDPDFISAIASLAQPLPGSDKKANLIVPLSTSEVVQQALNKHLLTQASDTQEGPAITYVGFDEYVGVSEVRQRVRSLASDRVVAVFPGSALMDLDVNGVSTEFAVTGEFLAAAAAGLDVNPAYDEATSLTKKSLTGFKSLVTRYDSTSMNLAAADGVSWLLERNGALLFRHHITTDTSSPLKREPTNRKVADRVRFSLADNLEQFISRKSLTSLTTDISLTVNSVMKSLVARELVSAFKDVLVTLDEFDDTIAHVSLRFKPVGSLLWLDVALTVTTAL